MLTEISSDFHETMQECCTRNKTDWVREIIQLQLIQSFRQEQSNSQNLENMLSNPVVTDENIT